MFLNFLIYSTFILFSLGQLGRISFLGQQINGYVYEISMLLTLIYLFVKYLFKPIAQSFKRLYMVYLFLLFILLSFLFDLRFYDFQQNLISFLYQIRLWFYFLFLVYLYYGLKKKTTLIKTLNISFFIFITLTAVLSVIQYMFYPDLRNLIYDGWDPHLFRMFGVFFDTSVSGAIYGIIFLFLFLKDDFIKNKYVRFFLIFIFFIFVFLTYARSLYLVFIITLFLIFLKAKQYKQLIFLPLVVLIVIILLPKTFGEGINLSRTFSIESRSNDYQSAIKIWEKKPLIGYGYNRIRYVKKELNLLGNDYQETHAGASFHSSFLIILVTSGLIGLIIFVASIIQLSRIANRGYIFLLFLSMLSLADNIIIQPMILFIFLIILLINYRQSF